MQDLMNRDRVSIPQGVFGEVMLFARRDMQFKVSFLGIESEKGDVTTASQGHYIYVNGGPMRAADVNVGVIVRNYEGDVL